MCEQWRFSTSGIRGLMGEGADKLNRQSIALISRALATVLSEDGQQGGKIAVCYDSRAHSAEFAAETARVLATAGFGIYLSAGPAPTPLLSFAVCRLGAVAGVNITASHNPKQYNGYKIYGADGVQVDESFARRMQAALDAGASLPAPDCARAAAILPIPAAIEEDYLRLVIGHSGVGGGAKGSVGGAQDSVSAVYTPLGGTGGRLMRVLCRRAGLALQFVEREMAPDSDLAGIARPSPDERAAFARALALGRHSGAELLLATDPDADRCGLMIGQADDYRLLSGNQTGLILLHYLLERAREQGRKLENRLVVQSLVSTPLTARICAEHGLRLITTPIGFRHIARLAADAPQKFLFGFEESGGYLATPYVHDKDGLSAACLILAAAAHFKRQGLDLAQVLEHIYARYGRLEDVTAAVDCPAEQARELMSALRAAPPARLGDIRLLAMRDHLQTGEPRADMLSFTAEGGGLLYLRASGTESKLKLYIFAPGAAACSALWQASRRHLLAAK